MFVALEKTSNRSRKVLLSASQHPSKVSGRPKKWSENIKNGKLVGHTDNYIQVRTDGHPELVNTIHKINLAKNKNTFIAGKLL